MILHQFVGEKSGTYHEKIDAETVASFRKVVGASGDDVPPTYITRLRQGEFAICERLRIPLSRVLHGEQTYEYLAPLRVGMSLEFETKISNAFEKKGASAHLSFFILETEVRDESKTRVALVKTTFIVRGELPK